MVAVYKEIWKAYLDVRAAVIQREVHKERKREVFEEISFQKRQLSAREQTKELVREEFTKKRESLPPNV